MNERLKRRTSGWVLDTLILGLAALVLLALVVPRGAVGAVPYFHVESRAPSPVLDSIRPAL